MCLIKIELQSKNTPTKNIRLDVTTTTASTHKNKVTKNKMMKDIALLPITFLLLELSSG